MVSLFKKKKNDRAKEEASEGVPDSIIKSYQTLRFPEDRKVTVTSREFQLFKKKEDIPLTWFERLAGIAGKIISVNPPDAKTKADIDSAINFTGMRITSKDVTALVYLTIMFFVISSIILVALALIPLMGILFISAAGVALAFYFLKYPINQMKMYRIEASSQVVLAILYMVVSMRVTPNLEQALRFSAANVTGPLAWDMRKLLWDIEMGKYYSASQAMTDYIAKWKSENEEFSEALRLIRDSRTHSSEKAEIILDEALDVILSGTKTRMKHYAQDLTLPVSIIHMMGIVLPILGSIMAPLAAVFLSDIAKPEYFFALYDVILPIFIIWFINSILKKRPTTFSQVDTSMHPDLPPQGSFSVRIGKKKVNLPAMPFALIVGLAFILPALLFFAANPESIISAKGTHDIVSMVMSMMLILGGAFGIATYCILSNFQRISIQDDVLKTESEFEMALFQLGNRISGGIPPELAIEKSADDVKDLSISGLFTITIRNMRNLGMTFREALLDEKYGAIRYYPSNLIRNIMFMVVDIARKGVKYAAEGMLTVSKYLRNIRETQEYIRDLLQESVSSMKFQAYMLTPMVTGLIVSMAQIIIKVLAILSSKLSSLSAGTDMPINISGGLMGGGDMSSTVSPEIFQIIIGIYLIEIIIILAMFMTKISQGENKVYMWYTAGKMLIVAVVMYFLVALGASTMFGELIASAVEGITG
ncbi:MAG: hypothetical protein NTU57_00130 [Candidatus Aenigmarchaeota archaeon]|nr:hypothetical protein [Candidatus Aenigmarchaeota archaeon]